MGLLVVGGPRGGHFAPDWGVARAGSPSTPARIAAGTRRQIYAWGGVPWNRPSPSPIVVVPNGLPQAGSFALYFRHRVCHPPTIATGLSVAHACACRPGPRASLPGKTRLGLWRPAMPGTRNRGVTAEFSPAPSAPRPSGPRIVSPSYSIGQAAALRGIIRGRGLIPAYGLGGCACSFLRRGWALLLWPVASCAAQWPRILVASRRFQARRSPRSARLFSEGGGRWITNPFFSFGSSLRHSDGAFFPQPFWLPTTIVGPKAFSRNPNAVILPPRGPPVRPESAAPPFPPWVL